MILRCIFDAFHFQNFPALQKMKQLTSEIPKLKEWLEIRPKTDSWRKSSILNYFTAFSSVLSFFQRQESSMYLFFSAFLFEYMIYSL